MLMKLALKSLMNRKGSVCLSLMAMTVSIFVLLGVEHIRHQAKDSFASTVSGVDLIVGAKTGSLNLLLYSVFRIGAPTNNIDWSSYKHYAAHPSVKWAIPISLGDSHKGFRVMGTTAEYFQHYRYGNKHALRFEQGQAFQKTLDVVLGAGVAKTLHYQLGDAIVVAHGIGNTSFQNHDKHPFRVVGILEPTGTPVDQTLHVHLQGIEAIHSNAIVSGKLDQFKTKSITAMLLGLKSKMTTFRLRRQINNDRREPLLAILPGVALSELWQMMRVLENTLLLVSILVFVAASLGVSAMLLASIRERTGEIHLLRVLGAPPWVVFMLIQLEALLITLASITLSMLLLSLCLVSAESYLIAEFGLHIKNNVFSANSGGLIVFIIVSACVVATIPALSAYSKASAKAR